MANLPITVRVSTPLPVSVRDLPKLERLAVAAAGVHGVKPDLITMGQEDECLVLSYELKAR